MIAINIKDIVAYKLASKTETKPPKHVDAISVGDYLVDLVIADNGDLQIFVDKEGYTNDNSVSFVVDTLLLESK